EFGAGRVGTQIEPTGRGPRTQARASVFPRMIPPYTTRRAVPTAVVVCPPLCPHWAGLWSRTTRGAAMRAKDRTGLTGEGRAAEYLDSCGHSVLARRWRSRTGELELVTRDGDEL